MKFVIVLLACVAVSSCAVVRQERDLGDFVLNQLGLGNVVAEVQNLGQNAIAQLTSSLTQLLFAGKEIWAQAMEIVKDLAQQLMSHAGNSQVIFQQHIASLSQLIQSAGKRAPVGDFVLNALGFGQVVDQLTQLSSGLYQQLMSVFTQLLFSGQQLLAQAKPILAQLLKDLKDHVSNAGPLVQAALGQLTQVLGQAGKRDLADVLMNTLGLGEVVSTVQAVGSQLYGQFVSVATQLLFAGKEIFAQAKVIFAQLLKDLKDHASNGTPYIQQAIGQLTSLLATQGRRDLGDFVLNQLGLGNVVAEVQNLGQNAIAQLTSSLTQLVFAGKDIWAQAVEIVKDLAQQLMSHAGNSQVIFQQHLASLSQLIQSAGKRAAVGDFVLNALGFGQVVDQLTQLSSGLYQQMMSVFTQLLFSGQQLLAQAKPILAQLFNDLKDHVSNAGPLVQAALGQLTQVLGQAGKRDLVDVLMNTLGLGEVVSTVQAVGSQFYGQFVSVATQLLFAGKEILAQAKVIFAQLLKDLKDHATNGTPYIQQAIGQLTSLLATQGK